MRRLPRWLDRSLAAHALLSFLLCLGITALWRRDEHPVLWVIQAAIYTSAATLGLALQRRRVSRAVGTDPRGLVELNRKLRHREVPQDPEEQATMRRLVAEHLGRMERAGRWLPYWLGLMGLAAAGMLALGTATGSLTLPLVFTFSVIAVCYWILWARRRSFDRCRSMQSALQSQAERVP